MVDDRYWGRSDITNYALADAEVIRLHERRVAAAHRVAEMLEAEVARDPAQAQGMIDDAHLFVIAQPVIEDGELLLRSVPGRSLRQWVGSAIVRGSPGRRQHYSPNIGGMASQLSPRAHDYAAHTYCVTSDRQVQPNGKLPADESGSYLGSWDFGVAITNLRGAVDLAKAQQLRSTPWPFSEDPDMARAITSCWISLVPSKIVWLSVSGFRGVMRWHGVALTRCFASRRFRLVPPFPPISRSKTRDQADFSPLRFRDIPTRARGV